MSNTGQALARTRTQLEQKQDTLAKHIERMKPEMARALPRHMDPERIARIATTVMRRTPALAQCTPASFLGALMTCAQLGLEPGPLGHAYLVPYGREVTFIAGYRGLVDLARRSGQVSSVSARVVRAEDDFSYEFGLDPKLHHKPAGSTGDITHAYAVVKLKDGGVDFDVMTKAEVDAVRDRSKASKNGPWVTDYAEMAKKTVLRRLLKTAPMSVEYQQAVANDGNARTRVEVEALDIAVPLDDIEDGELVDDPPLESDDAGGVSQGDWPPPTQPGGGATQ